MALFIPTYFSTISQYTSVVKSNTITFEAEGNYQKQSYRNRCYIFGANGKQLLNIPISNTNKILGKIKMRDVVIENSNWQRQHYKSLTTAYNHSPFFEFYKDDLQFIFTKKYKYLIDINIDSFLFINDALELSKKYNISKIYNENLKFRPFKTNELVRKILYLKNKEPKTCTCNNKQNRKGCNSISQYCHNF